MSSNNIFQMSQELRQQLDWLNEILIGDESSVINVNGKIKPSIDKSFSDRFAAIQAMVQGRLAVEAYTELPSSPPPGVILAEVWKDEDSTLNGLYGFTNGKWEKSPYDPQQQMEKQVERIDSETERLFGPSFPGAPEYFETVDVQSSALLQLQDIHRNIILELFGTEPHYNGELEVIDAPKHHRRFIVTDKSGSTMMDTDDFTHYEGEYETTDSDEEISFVVLDALGREIYPKHPPEVAEQQIEIKLARGNCQSLAQRLQRLIDSKGYPTTYTANEWRLRETRKRLRKLNMNEDDNLTIAVIGDSWSHNAPRWTWPVYHDLTRKFGIAAAGWTGFSYGWGTGIRPAGINGNVDISHVEVDLNGEWSAHYSKRPSPDLCSVSSQIESDNVTVSCHIAADAVDLFYIPASNSSCRYRFDSGHWHSLDLSIGESLGIAKLDLPSQSLSSFVLEIEVVSGTVELCGCNIKNSTATGVTVHKIAATGSQTAQWSTQTKTSEWQRGFSSLDADLVIVLHGTNDQGYHSSSSYHQCLSQIIDDVRSVNALSDILIIVPCENGRKNNRPMLDYQSAGLDVAMIKQCAFLNLQHVFGDHFTEYSHMSQRRWFNPDLIHPEPATGGRVIADAVLRLLCNL